MKDALDFPQLCASGKAVKRCEGGNGDEIVEVAYDTSTAHKAVHLIRDPFDNIVARFHLQKRRKLKLNAFEGNFTSSKEGLRAFCRYMNDKHKSDVEELWLDNEISMLRDVPCRDDFFQYVVWHNLAFLATEESLHLPTLVLYYEDYTNKFNDTVARIFDFLELKQQAEPYPFHEGHAYKDYFTLEERKAVKEAMEIIAINQTWQSIQHYFD